MLLYIMLAYLVLLVCIMVLYFCHSFLQMLFVSMLCLGLLTQFVYFKYCFASCTVLLICWFFIILCSHRLFISKVKGLCALWRNST